LESGQCVRVELGIRIMCQSGAWNQDNVSEWSLESG
jgi:hypothetical protein